MLEKIKAYIDGGQAVRNKLRYTMVYSEIVALSQKAIEAPAEAVVLAFNYGREKGYRMAKAEGKK